MTPAGEAAFEARREDRTAVYSYERRHEARFDKEQRAAFRANKAAWAWFERQSSPTVALATFWVVSAKRPETRAKRLATLDRVLRGGAARPGTSVLGIALQ